MPTDFTSDPIADESAERAVPFTEVTEDSIACLVDTFYGKIRHDPRLGPIFNGRIQDNWPRHLGTMRAFWSSVMLASGRYKGNPPMAHAGLSGLRPDDFQIWLAHFHETCRELFAPELAAQFGEKAERIAQSLQFALFYRPEDDDPLRRAL